MSQDLANEAVEAITNFAREAYGERIACTIIVTVDDGKGTVFLNAATNAPCAVCHARNFADREEADHGHGNRGAPELGRYRLDFRDRHRIIVGTGQKNPGRGRGEVC